MKPLGCPFWVLMTPVVWAIGDVLYPLVFGEPSVILTYYGVRFGSGC